MKKLFRDQRGAIDLILILVVFLAALLIGGYSYYQQKQNQKSFDAAGKGVTVAKQSKKKAPAKKSSSSSSAQSSAAVGSSWFVIDQFGVEGKPTAGITLQYTIKTSDGIPSAFFTSSELLALEAGCTTTFGPGGTISQYPAGADYHGDKIETVATAKKVGNYYYIFDQPQAYCSVAAANQAKEAVVQAAVKNVLSTLVVKP